MGKRKRIPKQQSPETQRIPEQKITDSQLVFDFSYPNWLKAYQGKEFTTFLKNEVTYAKSITKIIGEVIPKLAKEWLPEKNHYSEFVHCHEVPSTHEAYKMYCAAIKDIHGIGAEQLHLWQFGFKGSERLICDLSARKLTPLLIDYHHLGHPSKKYNQPDYKKFKFCPIEKFI